MANRMTYTNEDASISVELQRLGFGAMREHHEAIEELYLGDSPQAVIYDPRFDALMRAACASDDDYEALMSLDQNDVWALWEAFVEFMRFEDFFTAASQAQAQRQLAGMELQISARERQLALMQKLDAGLGGSSMDKLLKAITEARAEDPTLSEPGSKERLKEAARMKLQMQSSTTGADESTAGRRKK